MAERYKASYHTGKGSPTHNSREFDIEKADHINPEKTDMNVDHYFHPNVWEKIGKNATAVDYEMEIYNARYGKALDKTNSNYVLNRNKKRCREMSDWYKTFSPTESIFQVGNSDAAPDAEKLKNAFVRTVGIVRKKYPNIYRLSYSLHMDEATPHIHFRYIIEGEDRNGNRKPLKDSGFKLMGIDLPNPDKPKGRYNNRAMKFTEEVREIFYEELEKEGIEVDREVDPENAHLPIIKYKQKKESEKLEKIKEEISERQVELGQIQNDCKKQSKEYEKKMNEYRKLEISTDEIKALSKKRKLSAEERAKLMATAITSAENSAKAKKMQRINEKLESNNQRLNTELNKVIQERDNLEEQVVIGSTKEGYEETIKNRDNEIALLKNAINILYRFLNGRGLKDEFIRFANNSGQKIGIWIGSLLNDRER